MFCPVGSRFFGFDEFRFFGFTASQFFCNVNQADCCNDTSCRPPENTPKSSLHLHCSVKTRTKSFTCQLPVPGTDAEIPVGTVEEDRGGGGGGELAPNSYLLYITHFITLITLHIL